MLSRLHTIYVMECKEAGKYYVGLTGKTIGKLVFGAVTQKNVPRFVRRHGGYSKIVYSDMRENVLEAQARADELIQEYRQKYGDQNVAGGMSRRE